ncbi:hypothetical protein TURTL08_18420 [Turicimonas sp. TL08]
MRSLESKELVSERVGREYFKRKPKKVAVIAIANRLAHQLWAMAKKGEDRKKQSVLAAVDK